jgi:hypothetical protein
MNNLFSRAATALRNALTVDSTTQRFLEKTYVDVKMSSRLWGN